MRSLIQVTVSTFLDKIQVSESWQRKDLRNIIVLSERVVKESASQCRSLNVAIGDVNE
jgi:hypothetical protein